MSAILLIVAAALGQQNWYSYEPPGKNFRVELPSKPSSTSSRSVSNAGGRAQLTTAQVRAADATYTVQITEGADKVETKTLDEVIKQFAATMKADLEKVRPITVDGNPGREFGFSERSSGSEKRTKMRWVAAGNAVIVLIVTSTPGRELTADADWFLKSLEIGRAPGAAKGPRAKEPVSDQAEAKPAPQPEPEPEAQPQPAGRKPTTLRVVTVVKPPKNTKSYPVADLEDLPRSYTARDRDGFRDIGPEGSVLVGIRVSYVEKFGGPKIRSVQPIYRSAKNNHYLGRVYGDPIGPFATYAASAGYAIGGLVTHTGLMVDGFGIIFMKVNGDQLDPADTYNSPWIGDKEGGGRRDAVSQGGLVVGLQGRSNGKEVNAIGLTSLR